jgi:hypothetical protein
MSTLAILDFYGGKLMIAQKNVPLLELALTNKL